jgi:hypothetical protein
VTTPTGPAQTPPPEQPEQGVGADEATAAALALIVAALVAAGAAVALLGLPAATVGAIAGLGERRGQVVSRPGGRSDRDELRARAVALLERAGLSRATARLMAAAFLDQPLPAAGPTAGAWEAAQARDAALWRARYLLTAGRRVDDAAGQARRQAAAEHATSDRATRRRAVDEAARAAVGEQLERERRYFQQHQDANQTRVAGGRVLDDALAEHGPRLGWVAVRDNRTTRECLIADGGWFDLAANLPVIGPPGVALHGPHTGCRCRPGPPPNPPASSVNARLAAAGIYGRIHDDD